MHRKVLVQFTNKHSAFVVSGRPCSLEKQRWKNLQEKWEAASSRTSHKALEVIHLCTNTHARADTHMLSYKCTHMNKCFDVCVRTERSKEEKTSSRFDRWWFSYMLGNLWHNLLPGNLICSSDETPALHLSLSHLSVCHHLHLCLAGGISKVRRQKVGTEKWGKRKGGWLIDGDNGTQMRCWREIVTLSETIK